MIYYMKYSKHHSLLTEKAIGYAISMMPEGGTIWLIFADRNTIRSHFDFDQKLHNVSDELFNDKKVKISKKVDLAASVIGNKHNIDNGDIVIDVYIGNLYRIQKMGGAHTIHLPWLESESETLAEYYDELI